MWKFKPSKFKNVAPKIVRKEEWLAEVSANNLLDSCGSHIWASAAFTVFNTDVRGGGCLGVLPLENYKGKMKTKDLVPLLNCHSEFVNDCDFSLFDDYLLATCSRDCTVKIWQIPDNSALIGITEPTITLPKQTTKVENVRWNPQAANIIAFTTGHELRVSDVSTQQEKYVVDSHGDMIHNFCWHGNGSLILTAAKDKKLRIIDPRQQTVVEETEGHASVRESRVRWMGHSDLVLTTGFDQMRQREVVLRDLRNFSSPLGSKAFDTSTGVFLPLFDDDTNMLFLAGKGDTSIRYLEVTEKAPFFIENCSDSVGQVKGMTLVPKRALDVMSCEIERMMLLTKHNVIPVPYFVPRKSYHEFNHELFPDTFSGVPGMSAQQWLGGANDMGPTTSLDPITKPASLITISGPVVRHRHTEELQPDKPTTQPEKSQETKAPEPPKSTPAKKELSEISEPSKGVTAAEGPSGEETQSAIGQKASQLEHRLKSGTPKKDEKEPIASFRTNEPVEIKSFRAESGSTGLKSDPTGAMSGADFNPMPMPSVKVEKKKKKFLPGMRPCKFRHLKGVTHKIEHIENLRKLSKSMPGESDVFQANRTFCAVPLTGPGGVISIVQTTAAGRLPDTGVPGIQNGSTVMDFSWDPFDDHTLAVGCDNAKVNLWKITSEMLEVKQYSESSVLDQPHMSLIGHTEKIYFVSFHPLAKDVLASGSYDMTVRLWNVATGQEQLKLQGHTETIFCFAWSPDGQRCVTVCKDGKIRIYEPRTSSQPIKEGPGPEGTRGARILWACGGKFLITTGFDRMSTRVIAVYDPEDLTSPLHKCDLDVSPAILMTHYDEDSSTIFLTGRGEATVKSFEVAEDHPYLFPLSDYKADGLHQALSFLPKCVCDVKQVEFARAMRLTATIIEPVAFTVPRIKTQFFQDDIFPDTKVLWEPVMTSSEWFSGVNKLPRTISLKPDDMQALSAAPTEAPKAKKYENFQSYSQTHKSDDQRKDEDD